MDYNKIKFNNIFMFSIVNYSAMSHIFETLT